MRSCSSICNNMSKVAVNNLPWGTELVLGSDVDQRGICGRLSSASRQKPSSLDHHSETQLLMPFIGPVSGLMHSAPRQETFKHMLEEKGQSMPLYVERPSEELSGAASNEFQERPQVLSPTLLPERVSPAAHCTT